MSKMTDNGMLDEAIRLGSLSADQANRYMRLSSELLTAINTALQQLECGMPSKARDTLLDIKKTAMHKVLNPK